MFVKPTDKEKTMLKYQTEKVMAEVFYVNCPNQQQLNNAIWEFFETKELLWLSDAKNIAKKLKIELGIVLSHLKLLTQESPNPCLLRQFFYQVNMEQLQVIDALILEIIAKTQISSFSLQAETAFNNWVKTVFVCWQPMDKELKDVVAINSTNAQAFSPLNSLSCVLS